MIEYKSKHLTPHEYGPLLLQLSRASLSIENPPPQGMMQYAGREATPLNRFWGVVEQFVCKKKNFFFFPITLLTDVCPSVRG